MSMDTPRDESRDEKACMERHHEKDGSLTFVHAEERKRDRSQTILTREQMVVVPALSIVRVP